MFILCLVLCQFEITTLQMFNSCMGLMATMDSVAPYFKLVVEKKILKFSPGKVILEQQKRVKFNEPF